MKRRRYRYVFGAALAAIVAASLRFGVLPFDADPTDSASRPSAAGELSTTHSVGAPSDGAAVASESRGVATTPFDARGDDSDSFVRVTGSVVGLSFEPVAGAAVRLEIGADGEPPSATTTDAFGRFVLTARAGGPCRVAASAVGRSTAMRRSTLLAGVNFDAGEFLLAPAVPFSGSVVRTDGTPVDDARIGVSAASVGPAGAEFFCTTTSDAAGRFALPDAPPGPLMIVVGADRFSTQTFAHANDGRPAVVTLRRDGFVRGRVYDAATREPVADARVRVTTQGGDGVEVRSGPDGRYEAPWRRRDDDAPTESGSDEDAPLAVTAWTADAALSSDAGNVWSSGPLQGVPHALRGVPPAGGDLQLDLPLEGRGPAYGFVVDAFGARLAGKVVEVHLGGEIVAETTSGTDGSFRFARLPAARMLRLVVRADVLDARDGRWLDTKAPDPIPPLTLVDPGRTPVVAQAAGTVVRTRGRLTTDDGGAVAFRRLRFPCGARTMTDADGAFVVETESALDASAAPLFDDDDADCERTCDAPLAVWGDGHRGINGPLGPEPYAVDPSATAFEGEGLERVLIVRARRMYAVSVRFDGAPRGAAMKHSVDVFAADTGVEHPDAIAALAGDGMVVFRLRPGRWRFVGRRRVEDLGTDETAGAGSPSFDVAVEVPRDREVRVRARD